MYLSIRRSEHGGAQTSQAWWHNMLKIIQRIYHNVAEQTEGSGFIDMLQKVPDNHIHALDIRCWVIMETCDEQSLVHNAHSHTPIFIYHSHYPLPGHPGYQNAPEAALSKSL